MSSIIRNRNKRYRAASKSILQQSYGCSPYTFRQWIKKINKDLGAYEGGLYTPKQVQMIVDHLGEPPRLEHIIYEK